jgi:hypothetical protein
MKGETTMNRPLVAMVMAIVILSGAVSVEATGSIGCTLTGATLNPGVNIPETWTVVFPNLVQYGSLITSTMVGVNAAGYGVHGSAHLKGGFPAHLTWTEGPTPTIPEVRHVQVTLEANGQGTGKMVILEDLFGTFNASVVITSTTCAPATALP